MVYAQSLMDMVHRQDPAQPEFHQAVEEVVTSLKPLLNSDSRYADHKMLERIINPDRIIIFRVAWLDDKGEHQINRGYRIQFNNAVGPYKGGFRFHPSVNLSILKFLGFEQTFKNALTGLAIGGAKGGADFDPKGKSDHEVMRFCQAFMTEMYRYIGPTVDVPAGDIGVAAREIGFMYGQYKRITSRHEGAFTGKGYEWGGSLARKEATGYGAVYFARNMLGVRGDSLEGATCAVSGSGNVAIYTVEKLQQVGAKAVTVSDSNGMIHHPAGIDLAVLKQVKEVERGRLTRYKELCPDATYIPVSDYPKGRNMVWSVPCKAAFPSATQNELNADDARELLKNGCVCVAEGANMPSTQAAVDLFLEAKIAYGPGKAANAGGVAVSQMEMAQNASMKPWTFEKVDAELHGVMKHIFETAHATAVEFGQPHNLVMGANIASFRRVAHSMRDLGMY
ncbi:glutamate dehydrogenase, NADP-specific [uncultured delta proteobacterium]|uniref:Glutamate dehydrogenase n=1 Tax=uncultured delta proteobacterium TaxID=34034 RepID=A0A212JKS7_9DELT|nr:glutamate dehydrogenase, NADP-specific [uncultured delta proteobacterium]